MESDKQEYREVLVDVPVRDKNGNPIPFDSLSSGGARNEDGSLIVHYSNPRPPESGKQPEVDREFDEQLNRDYDARRRREEKEEEHRNRETAEFFSRLFNTYVLDPLMQEIILPRAAQLWDTKVLPAVKRLARHRPPVKPKQPKVTQVSGDTPEATVDTANPPATMPRTTSGTTEVPPTRKDTPLADVIHMDDYQNRRSA
ncbi:hypothetical protein IWX65_002673 [Arthrobacter sp. CAN_A214]|uniref:hypothetical protein n=1 Tax=Arthrobacter sp. CAN_A214 TaxID=2787720 RepID=UPI0018CB36A0